MRIHSKIKNPAQVQSLRVYAGQPRQILCSDDCQLVIKFDTENGTETLPLGAVSGLVELQSATDWIVACLTGTMYAEADKERVKVFDHVSYASLDLPRSETPIERMVRIQQQQINMLMKGKENGTDARDIGVLAKKATPQTSRIDEIGSAEASSPPTTEVEADKLSGEDQKSTRS